MPNIKDLSGLKFGKLVVISLHSERTKQKKTKWLCECECEKHTRIVVTAASLSRGNRTSCGCGIGGKLDLKGHIQGYLTVLREDSIRKSGSVTWICHCAGCGKDVSIAARLLMRGQKSCGCLRTEAVEPVGLMGLVGYYKKNATAKGREWNLDIDTCRTLFFAVCHYCGRQPASVYVYKGTKIPVTILRNGIDRKDSSLGYVLGNVVTCCQQCNMAKSDYSYTEFLEMITAIYEYRIEKRDIL